jgi:hypothetical protein
MQGGDLGKREREDAFSILALSRMATAWHPKRIRIARVVSDLCRDFDELADRTYVTPKRYSADGFATF